MKIIKIEDANVMLGDDENKITTVPRESINYENPRVGDTVKLFKDENSTIVMKDETPSTIINKTMNQTIISGNGNEKIINKHIFVWVGTFLFGGVGVDRFMRGQIGLGVLKLITAGACGIWALVDWIIALMKAYGGPFGSEDNIVFIDKKYAK